MVERCHCLSSKNACEVCANRLSSRRGEVSRPVPPSEHCFPLGLCLARELRSCSQRRKTLSTHGRPNSSKRRKTLSAHGRPNSSKRRKTLSAHGRPNSVNPAPYPPRIKPMFETMCEDERLGLAQSLLLTYGIDPLKLGRVYDLLSRLHNIYKHGMWKPDSPAIQKFNELITQAHKIWDKMSEADQIQVEGFFRSTTRFTLKAEALSTQAISC